MKVLLWLALAIAPDGLIIRGVEMRAPGVFSWPLVSGDEVQAKSGALVEFRDSSRLYLNNDCRIQLEPGGSVHVMEGTLTYRLAANSTLSLHAVDRFLTRAQSASGTIVVKSGKVQIAFGTHPPPFAWDEKALMQRLNWTLGVHLP